MTDWRAGSLKGGMSGGGGGNLTVQAIPFIFQVTRSLVKNVISPLRWKVKKKKKITNTLVLALDG